MTFAVAARSGMKQIAGGLLLIIHLHANSGTVATAAAEDACRRYFAALAQHGFRATPEFIHPDELVRFRELVLATLSADNPRSAELRRTAYGPNATPETVRGLAPLDVIRTFAEALSDGAPGKIRQAPYSIVGSLVEADVVHVLVRAQYRIAGSRVATELQVLSFKPHQSTWLMLLPQELERLGQRIDKIPSR